MPQAPEVRGLGTPWPTSQISKNGDWDPRDEEPLVLSCSRKEGRYPTRMWRGESHGRKLQRGSVRVEPAHEARDLFPLSLVDSRHSKHSTTAGKTMKFVTIPLPPPTTPPLLFFCALCAQPRLCLSHMLRYINAD